MILILFKILLTQGRILGFLSTLSVSSFSDWFLNAYRVLTLFWLCGQHWTKLTPTPAPEELASQQGCMDMRGGRWGTGAVDG